MNNSSFQDYLKRKEFTTEKRKRSPKTGAADKLSEHRTGEALSSQKYLRLLELLHCLPTLLSTRRSGQNSYKLFSKWVNPVYR